MLSVQLSNLEAILLMDGVIYPYPCILITMKLYRKNQLFSVSYILKALLNV